MESCATLTDSRPTRRLVLGAAGLLFAGVALVPAFGSHRTWPGGKRGAVSLSYDDGLDSQLDYAIPELDTAGLKGSFFVTANQIAKRLDDWRHAADHGHELADHTVDHPCDLRPFRPEAFIAHEVAPVERLLDRLEGPMRAHLYAYPCDVTDLGPGSPNHQAKIYARLLKRAGITAARTSEGAPNNPGRVRHRLYRLQALAIGYDAPDLQAVTDYLDLAAAKGHWAILVFHNVLPATGDKGDTSVVEHRAILDAVAARDLFCAPMGTILAQVLDRRQV